MAGQEQVRSTRSEAGTPGWLVLVLAGSAMLLVAWTLLLGLVAQGVTVPAAVRPVTATGSILAAIGYLLVLGLFLLAVVEWRHRRRPAGHEVSYVLPVLGIVAAVAAVLGLFSYARCHSDISVLYEAYWTLLMFVGIARNHAEEIVCAGIPSLAFQIGRVLALCVLFGGAAAALSLALRGPLSKNRLARDPAAKCFVGVDEQSLPLVAEAINDEDDGTGRVYVVDPDPAAPVVSAATALGAVHVEGFGDEPDLLRRAVRKPRWGAPRHPLGIREFACLSADTDANLAFLDALLAAMADAAPGDHPASGQPVAIRVRIDEIHRGERWWRQQAQQMSFLHRPYTVDRVGVYDSTAHRILSGIKERAVGRPAVVVDGDTSVALAVVKQLAMEANWSLMRHDQRPDLAPFAPHVVLTGAGAPDVARDARGLWDLTGVELTVRADLDPWQVDREPLAVDSVFAVLSDPDRGSVLHGERVAERLYAKGVWVVAQPGSPLELVEWIGSGRVGQSGQRDTSAVQVQPLVLAETDRESTWERAARHVAQLDDPPGDPAEHVHDVLAVGTLVRDQGLVWGPPHGAWRAGLCCDTAAAGGAHELACLFAGLCADQPREPAAATRVLEHVLASLRVLGLSPWFRVTRVGTIERADRLTYSVHLDTNRGVQNGVAGDWLITDSGSRWVVSHEGFAASFDVTPPFRTEYTNLRRVGSGMWARRAVPGERVVARGAESLAADGDWVLREENISWVVPRQTFEKGYALATGSRDGRESAG